MTPHPILEPDLPIIDAHHHLRETPVIRYLLDELLADLNTGHAIKASVFIEGGTQYYDSGPEALRPVGETAFAAQAARAAAARGGPLACAAIVGYADLTDPMAGDVLRAHIDAGLGRFRGVRMLTGIDGEFKPTHREVTAGVLGTPEFARGMHELRNLGLSYDCLVYFSQLDEVLDLARRCPDTPIVLNHIGQPIRIGRYASQREEVRARWQAGIRALSHCANVFLKLGGLGVSAIGYHYRDHQPPVTPEHMAMDWLPWMAHCIKCFGTARCMFESNFPVDNTLGNYDAVWNAFKVIARGCSAAEKADLFYETARRVYRIAVPPPA